MAVEFELTSLPCSLSFNSLPLFQVFCCFQRLYPLVCASVYIFAFVCMRGCQCILCRYVHDSLSLSVCMCVCLCVALIVAAVIITPRLNE